MHTNPAITDPGIDEGAYYAVKGYLYQYDKTLVEVFKNPEAVVAFENEQDINHDDFVLQVKHRESQTYSASKLRRSIRHLLGYFSKKRPTKLVLYCHFKDKKPQTWRLSAAELDAIIGGDAKEQYGSDIRDAFLECFSVQFSEDYEGQFVHTISLIKSAFHLRDDESPVLYHAIFRSKLLDRSLLPRKERIVSLKELQAFLDGTETTIFHQAYSKHLGRSKYAALIKKQYFTSRLPNIENIERLFVIHCDDPIRLNDLCKCAARISRKFFRKGKVRPPYVTFHGLPEHRLNEMKQYLYEQDTKFFDGTHFRGDRFRLDEMASDRTARGTYTIKIIPSEELDNATGKIDFREVFQFFIEDPLRLRVTGDHRKIQVNKTEEVLEMIS